MLPQGAGKSLQFISEGPGEVTGFYAGAMTRITIEVPDDVAERVNAAAAERGVAPEQLAGQAVAEQFPARRRLGFIGIGDSGDNGGDIGRRHHEIIRDAFADKTARDV